MRKIFLLIFMVIFFVACENSSIGNVELNDNSKREWTTIVYMAADNNLESAGIDDLKELESVNLAGSRMSILVLLDRADGYDERVGNWTDTRLFEVKYDSKSNKGVIVSKRLDCRELGLAADTDTELDMGKSETLSGVIDFAKRKYEAEHYALVMWGHGNGWRGVSASGKSAEENKVYREIAFDDKTNTCMTIPELRKAIEKKDLDVIAFDTCFGALAENFYELKDCAKILVGSAGRVPSNGFDYADFIMRYKADEKTESDFAKNIAESSSVGMSVVKAEMISDAAFAINNLAEEISKLITNESEREKNLKIFLEEISGYGIGELHSDYYIDVFDFAKKYSESEVPEISKAALALMEAMNKAVIPIKADYPQLGLYFGEMVSEKLFMPKYSSLYINGGDTEGKTMFVNEMSGWVPTKDGEGSLLDKLFIMNLNGGEL